MSDRHLACLALSRAPKKRADLVAECVAALDRSRNGAVAKAALFALQKVAAHAPGSRVAIAKAAGKTLADLVDGDRGRSHRKMTLHVLLNVSVDRDAVAPLAKAVLLPLVNLATASPDDVDAESREFACSVLANVARDKACSQLIYLHKLDMGFAPARIGRESDIMMPRLRDEADAPASPTVLKSPARDTHKAAVPGAARRRGGLDDRRLEMRSGVSYGDWMTKAFPVEVHRLSKRGPPKGPKKASDAFLEDPGRAATQWAKGPEALWNPGVSREPAKVFFVRSLHESTSRRAFDDPARGRPPALEANAAAGAEITRPRPGSFRVGPCGSRGSVTTRNGEDPWSPLVEVATARPVAQPSATGARGQDLERRGTKRCVLSPGGARNAFAFVDDEAGGVFWDLRQQRDTHLCAFKHVEGSRVGDLFPSYGFEAPDGTTQTYHLHHASKLSSEVLDPGDWPDPDPPKFWDDGDRAFDDLQAVAVPDAESLAGAKAMVKFPDPPRCPSVTRHHMTHLRTFVALSGRKDRIPWGQLPRFSLHVLAKRKKPPPEKPQVKKQTVRRSAWKLDDSIFAPRKRESDAKDFWNTLAIHEKMMEEDIRKMAAMPRFPKFISRLAGNRPNAEGSDAVMAALKKHLAPMYRILCNAMDYYGYRTTNDDPFDMALNAYNLFLKDSKLVDEKKITTEAAQRVFVQVNVEIGGEKRLNEANDDYALMRHEFVEAIFRLTTVKYDLEVRAADDPDAAAETRAAKGCEGGQLQRLLVRSFSTRFG